MILRYQSFCFAHIGVLHVLTKCPSRASVFCFASQNRSTAMSRANDMKGSHRMASSIDRFQEIASQPKFKGWSVVDEISTGVKIPFFGSTIDYKLDTPAGILPYTSIIRSFGWAVVLGITLDETVPTLVQWKPGVNQASWELPPGGIGKVPPDTSEEEILRLTQAGYLKETGFGGGDWEQLGRIMIETGKYRGAGPDDHGLPARMYLATGLTHKAEVRSPRPEEIMETLMVPYRELPAVVDSGLFIEESALCCALLAMRRMSII